MTAVKSPITKLKVIVEAATEIRDVDGMMYLRN